MPDFVLYAVVTVAAVAWVAGMAFVLHATTRKSLEKWGHF